MKMKCILLAALVFGAIFVYSVTGKAVVEAELAGIALLEPKMDGGMSLMQALKERKSTRDFDFKDLPLQVMSDLLWAANGINRSESGKRTAPSANNKQEIDIYVVKGDGVYIYDAAKNMLMPVVKGDLRAMTGKQSFVKDAPVNLVYVADMSKRGKGSNAEFYAAADTGFIAQNVYLYCVSSGLGTVVRGSVDKEALAKEIKLRKDQMVILAQTVGYPKD